MSSRRKRSRKKSSQSFKSDRKRTGFQTFIETIMGVAVALIFVGVAYWWFFIREPAPEIVQEEVSVGAVKDGVVDNADRFETILESGNLEKLTELLVKMEDTQQDAEVPVRLETLSNRVKVAEKILAHPDLTEEKRVMTARAMLKSMGVFYGISYDEGILGDGTVVSRYLDMCRRYKSDPDEGLARDAHISYTKLLVFEMSQGGSAADGDSLKDAFFELIQKFPDDKAVIQNIQVLIKHVVKLDPRVAATIKRDVVQAYDESDVADPEVKRLVRQLKDRIILEESGISELAQVAANSGNYDEYIEKLMELLEIPDTGLMFVNRVYEAIGFFEQTNRHELAAKILDKLGETGFDRTDPMAKQQALRIAKFGKIRNKIFGQKIDLSDTDRYGNPVDVARLDGRPIVIFYYSPNAPNTGAAINGLANIYRQISRTNLQVIAIEVERARGARMESGFNSRWISIQSDPDPKLSVSEIFTRCPVSHVPYFVVVDRAGIVRGLNVQLSQIRTMVEQIAAEETNVP